MSNGFISQLDEYALIDLETALAYLKLTPDQGEQDNYVEQMINRASVMIENYCNRRFKARHYIKERHNGERQENLYFKQYPVLAVNLDELAWDSSTRKVVRDDGGNFLDDGFKAGDMVLVQNSNKNSGLFTIAIDGVEADHLVFEEDIQDDSEDNNVVLSHFRELWIDGYQVNENDFTIFSDYLYYPRGLPVGQGNIRITYYAGYEKIPYDLQQACLKFVKLVYEKSENIQSEKLGPYSITYFDKGNGYYTVPRDIKVILDSYKKWVI